MNIPLLYVAIFQLHLHMEYTSLSWYDIPELLFPIRISIIEGCCQQGSTEPTVSNGEAEVIALKVWHSPTRFGKCYGIFVFFIMALLTWLYARVDILLTCGKHLHDRIISLRGDVWDHKISLTPPLFIEVPVPIQEHERSCICVLGVSIFPLSMILIFDFLNWSDSVIFFVLKGHNFFFAILFQKRESLLSGCTMKSGVNQIFAKNDILELVSGIANQIARSRISVL